MEKRDLLEKQLDHYYSWILSDKKQSVTTRSWCATVWIATVALVTSDKVDLSPLRFTIIIHLPILLFWILDGFQNTFINLNEQEAKRIEEALVSDKMENIDLREHLLMSSHANTPFATKVSALFTSLFLQETLFLFYLVLVAASVILSIIIPR
ncbi:hypothetical protein [Microseira sp. BLCC-F43]|jgi:hypothetical protein|uniref:hypothetical protein n=1 Tax=Microseira sp. BLCC-F43 TaxID=3153602 RepID=UPI0035B9186A